MSTLQKLLDGITTLVTHYVTDKKTGELCGAIVPHNGKYVVCGVLGNCGLDTSKMVACREFKQFRRACQRAAEILNGGDPVNIAPVL